jgi:hypothetical protein
MVCNGEGNSDDLSVQVELRLVGNFRHLNLERDRSLDTKQQRDEVRMCIKNLMSTDIHTYPVNQTMPVPHKCVG